MNLNAMNLFLSEENIKRHLEHLRTQKLKYSILEKSVPELKGKSIKEILRSGIKRDIKDEATKLLLYIRSHEVFFNSFTELPRKSMNLINNYSSREKFIYDVYTSSMENDYGFLYVYNDKQGLTHIAFNKEMDGAFIRYEPILALDLYEHTYFADYGFAKDKFLRGALAYFDTGRLIVDKT